MQDLQLIAKNFEYPDEVKESFRVMGMMREDASSPSVVSLKLNLTGLLCS